MALAVHLSMLTNSVPVQRVTPHGKFLSRAGQKFFFETHRLEKELLSCTGEELTVWGDALNRNGVGKHRKVHCQSHATGRIQRIWGFFGKYAPGTNQLG